MEKEKILFLGCGNMGSALIQSFISGGVNPNSFLIIKPTRHNLIASLKYLSSCAELPDNYSPNLVFFCFKPQDAKEIITQYLGYAKFNKNTVFISILAGKKVDFFRAFLGADAKVVRLMPNLPMVVGEGIFAYYSQFKITHDILSFLSLLGDHVRVEQEELLDVVTAVSGSGPAYLFYFIKSLVSAAEKLGLSKDQANKLIKKTVYGSAKMAFNNPDDDLDNLLSRITSKGGTTQAALDVFKKQNFDQVVLSGLTAAFNKAKTL